MFGRRTPKSEKWKKLPLVNHHIHNISLTERNWKDFRRIVSIDPGGLRRELRSFALRIEKRPMNSGPIEMEVFEVVKFTHPSDEKLKAESSSELYKRVNNFLDKYYEYFIQSHVIIIEQQMHVNYQSIRIMQHVITYFSLMLRNTKLLPMLIEIDNKLKTKELNSPPNLNENGIKKWSIELAEQLLILRNDQESLNILKQAKKKDDLADSILQSEALCRYLGWPSTYTEHESRFTLIPEQRTYVPTFSDSRKNLYAFMTSDSSINTKLAKINIVESK